MQEILLVNPRKRRRRRRNPGFFAPVRRRRRSYRVMRRRRNPAALPRVGQITQMLVPATQGALGAIATDAVFRMVPLPGALAQLKTGFLAPVTKIAVAVGVGALATAVGGRSLGRHMTSGALVMIAYDFWRAMLARFVPQAAGEYISGLGYQNPGLLVEDSQPALGEYISGMGDGSMISDFDEMQAFQ
jgi:hypothetical protein